MIKISVILPVYNVEKYIEKCINSLINQTLRELEFIFIDDCSTDNSIKTVEKYAKKDERIKIFYNKENSGPGVSRNRGIKEAKGEYLSFIDPDDWVDLDYFEKLYLKAKEKDYDIVKTKRVKLFGDEKIPQNKLNDSIAEKYPKTPLYRIFSYEHTTAVYKSSLIKENNIGYGIYKHGEDTTFLLKVCYFAKSIVLIDGTYYYYSINKGSITQVKNMDYYFGYLKTLQEKIDFLNSIINEENKNIVCPAYKHYFNKFMSIYHMPIYKNRKNKKCALEIYDNLCELQKNIKYYDDYKNLLTDSDPCFYLMDNNYEGYIAFLKKIGAAPSLKDIFFIGNEWENGERYKLIKILGLKFKLLKKQCKCQIDFQE